MKCLLLALTIFFSTTTALAMENSNEELQDLSYMLFDFPEDPTYGVENLDSSKLDFSIESLVYINEYLDTVRDMELSDQDYFIVCLRAGAYVGEVIRKNDTKQTWQWLSYDQALEVDQEFIEQLGESIGTIAVIYSSEGTLAFPLAKIQKYLENGSEDDVQFFAQAMMAKFTE